MPDHNYPRLVLLVVLFAINLAILGATVTSATPYGPYNGNWDGASELRTIASEESTVTLAHTTTAYEDATADSTAFILAPQDQYRAAESARVRQFVQRGGTLVIAAEANQTNDLLVNLGLTARLDGRLLRDEQEHYRDPALPIATEVLDHNVTTGVDQLTLNYGTVINLTTTTATTGSASRDNLNTDDAWKGEFLINSSGFAYIDSNNNSQLDDSERVRERPVAVTEPVSQGRVVVVSDASVFTNAMFERTGNDRFARNLVESGDRVLLDYSHGHPLPPLVYALLVVRSTPLLQFGLGLLALGCVAIGVRLSDRSLPDWLSMGETATDGDSVGQLDEDELSAFLTDRHPEWSDRRVQRVTKAIIRRREQRGDND
ncbi:hypothetical protein SAMN05216388_10334 [Halorientalis persicus]|uniref:DUF4350 domain-containing protein n=1 Tax=Halorientalis persicus TaxID=1367881 RepID=A0A1H8V4C2_9EURY|nr:hypothetical protein SAMN05216388_10334 [Halorientalis persicus]